MESKLKQKNDAEIAEATSAEEINLPMFEIALAPLKNPVGRPRKYKTALQFLERAYAYFRYCVENPILTNNRRRHRRDDKNGDMKEQANESVPQPFSISGLCAFCHIYEDWEEFKKRYTDDKQPDAQQFADIFRACENVIRSQQINGAMVGVYHPNIVARINGLAERVENTSKDNKRTLTVEQYVALLNGMEIKD